MENLLLLHGALGAASTLEPLQQALQAHYRVYTLDFSGHGGNILPEEPFSIDLFAQDVLRLLAQQGIESTHIFGYSMGGYVALRLAQLQPERIKSIFTLATKFGWSPEAAEKETKLLNPEKIALKVPQFAATLAQRHAPQDWKHLMHKTTAMMLQLGAGPVLTSETLPKIPVPAQLAVGDRDHMVSVEETLWAFRLLPSARLLVLPDTRHPLETVPVQRLSKEIMQFTRSLSFQSAPSH